jgi:hypothetical protein
MRAGEALGLEIGKHNSTDCRTLYIRQKAKRGIIQPYLKTQNGERDVDLCTDLAALLKDFIGTRTSGLLLHIERSTAAPGKYLSGQPSPYPEKPGACEGRIQHFLALPDHTLEQVRLP